MRENDFRKTFFSAENAGNIPEKPVFWHFLEILSLALTDFCSRNCLKIAGTADFRRKNGISWISRAVLYIFSWNFAHWCKMAIPKMWRSPIFEKHFFPAENAGNVPEKPVFRHFLVISSLVFPDFRPKMPEICQKSPFLQIFIGLFPNITLFFTEKRY